MEPLSALSLAAAIVQFVDFSSKILVTGYESYHSTHGTTQEQFDLEELTQNLFKFQDLLATRPSGFEEDDDIGNGPQTLSAQDLSPQNLELRTTGARAQECDENQKALKELAIQCRGLAEEILRLLKDLKVHGTGALRTWDSFRQSCRSRFKKSQITRLETKLKNISEHINSRLLYMIR